jgi:hypothetical protein
MNPVFIRRKHILLFIYDTMSFADCQAKAEILFLSHAKKRAWKACGIPKIRSALAFYARICYNRAKSCERRRICPHWKNTAHVRYAPARAVSIVRKTATGDAVRECSPVLRM